MSKRVRQAVCLICLLVCGLFCMRAAATEEAIDTEALGSLTVSYTFGTDADTQKNLALSGVLFQLYRVAGVSADGTYTITSEFADSGVTDSQLNDMEHAQDVTQVMSLLEAWMGGTVSGTETENDSDMGTNSDSEIKKENDTDTEGETSSGTEKAKAVSGQESTQNRVSVCQEAVTDESGMVVFVDLQTGLYLLIAEDLTEGEVLYSNSSALISIPSVSSTGTGWEYTITVNAKAEATIISSDPEPDTEALTEASTEPSTEAVTENLTEVETEPPTENSTETGTEPPTENSTEAESELSTENSTEAGTEPLTESSTEAETESATENSTEAETELPTENSNETAAESSTNAVTDAQTEISAESSSEAETAEAVQTGDTTPLVTSLLVMLGAFGVIFVVCLLRGRKLMR
ncbi:MAG: hypothetical protein LIP12_10905 [Clostridiales bacterium]|nr:hypothetical protein [Clostridiales bacterium]